MKQLGFAFDQGRCIGCRTCQLACKDYKNTQTHVNYRRVYEYEGGDWQQDENGVVKAQIFAAYASIACNHCDNPACMRVCPVKAIEKHPKSGIVEIDTEKCIGCGACAVGCPYDAPQKIGDSGKYNKCNLCRERLEEGLKPACVEACPSRALHFGDISALREKFGAEAGLAPLPNPDLTKPNITIIACKESRPYNTGGITVKLPHSPDKAVIAVVSPTEDA